MPLGGLGLPGGDRAKGLAQLQRARTSGVLLKAEAAYQLHLVDLWYENKIDEAIETAPAAKIERIGRVAFELARKRKNRVLSAEKANVMHTGVLWREEIQKLHDTDYNWRIEPEICGVSRAVADIGSHWMDMIQHLTNLKITALCADLNIVHPVRKRPKGSVETADFLSFSLRVVGARTGLLANPAVTP